jgi:hypothetical protein
MLFYIIKPEENGMHIDEGKKFDRRNIAKNIKSGIITQKDYEIFLSRLPDVSDKLFNPEEITAAMDEIKSKKESEASLKKKTMKKKLKGKGK